MYNSAIGACAVCTEWQRALGMLENMELSNLRMDATGISAVIGACESADQWQLTAELLFDLEAFAEQIPFIH